MIGLFIPSRHDRIVYILLAMMDDSFESRREAVQTLICFSKPRVHCTFPEELAGICLCLGNWLPNELSAFLGNAMPLAMSGHV